MQNRRSAKNFQLWVFLKKYYAKPTEDRTLIFVSIILICIQGLDQSSVLQKNLSPAGVKHSHIKGSFIVIVKFHCPCAGSGFPEMPSFESNCPCILCFYIKQTESHDQQQPISCSLGSSGYSANISSSSLLNSAVVHSRAEVKNALWHHVEQARSFEDYLVSLPAMFKGVYIECWQLFPVVKPTHYSNSVTNSHTQISKMLFIINFSTITSTVFYIAAPRGIGVTLNPKGGGLKSPS